MRVIKMYSLNGEPKKMRFSVEKIKIETMNLTMNPKIG
jgi:hypothetical protein